MTDPSPIPADDPARTLVVADPADPALTNLAIAGGTYTILVTGAETAGAYTLIEMRVPPHAGPPPHRHDFEEMFHVLEGEIELTFRGSTARAAAGTTVNVPANASHSFRNVSGAPARLLCLCTPAGQDDFFKAVGDPLASRDAKPPALSQDELAERGRRARALAPQYKSELLVP